MKRIILNFTNFCKQFYKSFTTKVTQTVEYYYLRYFSKKDKATTERIAQGEPYLGASGTYIYHDLIKGGTRSFLPSNLCEKRKIETQKELAYYQLHLSKVNETQIKPVCKPEKQPQEVKSDQVTEYTLEQQEIMLWDAHQHQLLAQYEREYSF